MIEFISSEGNKISFESLSNQIKNNDPFFKEIMKKEDYSSYQMVIDGNEENKISFENVFQLQVNVKEAGTFHFLFNKDSFDKNEAIKKVSELKALEIKDEDSAKEKINALIESLKDYKPLFIVFKLLKGSLITNDTLLSMNIEYPLFYVEVTPEEIKEEKVEEKKVTNSTENKFVSFVKHVGTIIAKNKFHLLLILVSTLLIGSTIPLSVLNIYAQNAIYIFLIICTVIGVMMNGYTYWDYFKKRGFKETLFVLSAITNVIGVGASVGVFTIFYNISTKAENDIGLSSYLLICALSTLGICALTILVTYALPKLINLFKTKKK